MLGIGENNDALYNESVNDVDGINLRFYRRISDAGPERSAGRSDNRSIGPRSVVSAPKECLGPYATRDHLQPHHTGHNTPETRQTSSGRPRGYQHNTHS